MTATISANRRITDHEPLRAVRSRVPPASVAGCALPAYRHDAALPFLQRANPADHLLDVQRLGARSDGGEAMKFGDRQGWIMFAIAVAFIIAEFLISRWTPIP